MALTDSPAPRGSLDPAAALSPCRLIGVSVAQSVASAVLAPSLRQVADMLALNWRSRLTWAACDKYLAGNTFYTASQLGGMQVSQSAPPGWLAALAAGRQGTV